MQRRTERWTRSRRQEAALAAARLADEHTQRHGLIAYLDYARERGIELPYPFSDRSRWACKARRCRP